METDELISTLGVGYIDEMLQEYEHDCQWLQQIKADLGQQSRNMLNKANATLRCAMNDLKMLQETILKEHQTNNNPKKEHMKQYTGTKTVKAEPMTYGEAYKRGLIRENAYVEEYSDNKGYHVVYPDNYESWSPAEVFEDAYKVSETPLDRLNIELSDLNLKRKKLEISYTSRTTAKTFRLSHSELVLSLSLNSTLWRRTSILQPFANPVWRGTKSVGLQVSHSSKSCLCSAKASLSVVADGMVKVSWCSSKCRPTSRLKKYRICSRSRRKQSVISSPPATT